MTDPVATSRISRYRFCTSSVIGTVTVIGSTKEGAQSPEQFPVLDWQKEELAKRKAAYLQNPDSGSSWEAAKERIRRGHYGALLHRLVATG
jgi:hypothetical protein